MATVATSNGVYSLPAFRGRVQDHVPLMDAWMNFNRAKRTAHCVAYGTLTSWHGTTFGSRQRIEPPLLMPSLLAMAAVSATQEWKFHSLNVS